MDDSEAVARLIEKVFDQPVMLHGIWVKYGGILAWFSHAFGPSGGSVESETASHPRARKARAR
jgi:hypothetical protein